MINTNEDIVTQISALRREDASKNGREWFVGDLRWIDVIFAKG